MEGTLQELRASEASLQRLGPSEAEGISKALELEEDVQVWESQRLVAK